MLVAPVSAVVRQCPNCLSHSDGVFCPKCGQKDVDLERPIGALIRELARETFEVDGRTWRTIRTMFQRPGMLTSEFLAGKRRKYTPPLRLYLVMSVAFFVLAAWLASRGMLLDTGQSLEADARGQAQFLSEELPRLMFVLLPIFALLLKIVYPRRLYFDHIIHSLHLHSVAYVAFALMLPLEDMRHWLPVGLQFLILAYLIGHLVVSLHRVYTSSWGIAAAKTLVILLAYLILVGLVIEGASNFIILSD